MTDAAKATDLTVAQTILQQLGGGRFVAMTGAKNLLGGPDHLQFHLPANFARGGINLVRIKLEPSDTYLVKFYKVPRGAKPPVVVSETDGAYAEDLGRLFRDATGLETRL